MDDVGPLYSPGRMGRRGSRKMSRDGAFDDQFDNDNWDSTTYTSPGVTTRRRSSLAQMEDMQNAHMLMTMTADSPVAAMRPPPVSQSAAAASPQTHNTRYGGRAPTRTDDAAAYASASAAVLAAASTGSTVGRKRVSRGDESGEAKRTRRLEENRLAAKKSREKKKEYIQMLESRLTQLESHNSLLINELHRLRQQGAPQQWAGQQQMQHQGNGSGGAGYEHDGGM